MCFVCFSFSVCICSFNFHAGRYIPEPASWALTSEFSCCQLTSSTDTNCFNLSKYCVYISTSLCPAPYNLWKIQKKMIIQIHVFCLHFDWFGCNFSKSTPSIRRGSIQFQIDHLKWQYEDGTYLHPEWFDGTWTFFVDGETVREINDFVLRSVNHQHRWCHLWNLINTRECIKEPRSSCGWKCDTHTRHQRRMKYYRSNFVSNAQWKNIWS